MCRNHCLEDVKNLDQVIQLNLNTTLIRLFILFANSRTDHFNTFQPILELVNGVQRNGPYVGLCNACPNHFNPFEIQLLFVRLSYAVQQGSSYLQTRRIFQPYSSDTKKKLVFNHRSFPCLISSAATGLSLISG